MGSLSTSQNDTVPKRLDLDWVLEASLSTSQNDTVPKLCTSRTAEESV